LEAVAVHKRRLSCRFSSENRIRRESYNYCNGGLEKTAEKRGVTVVCSNRTASLEDDALSSLSIAVIIPNGLLELNFVYPDDNTALPLRIVGPSIWRKLDVAIRHLNSITAPVVTLILIAIYCCTSRQDDDGLHRERPLVSSRRHPLLLEALPLFILSAHASTHSSTHAN
jgi:hypothetical protein